MSGKYGQQVKRPAMNGGWVRFEPKTAAGKFDKYDRELVVIVSVTKSGAKVYLTSRVMEALDNPEWIEVMTRGNNVGIMKSEDSSRGIAYRVSKSTKDSKEIGMRFLNLNAFVKQYRISSGAYTAHVEGGVVIFDLASMPSEI